VSTVHVVLPGDVDDATVPSGGNIYDRRVCERLDVRELPIDGTWPRPDDLARTRLAGALDALPDGAVVLADGLVACGVPEVLVPRARRLRLAVLVHMPLADETGLAPDIAAELDLREREALGAAAAVVTTSPWAARRLAAHHGLEAKRVHVVPPGTDPAPLADGTDGASRLLCVASLTPLKAQDLLIEALATVEEPWELLCAGALSRAPAYVTRVEDLVVRRGLDDRVRLTGPLTGKELDAAYAEADLVVLASRAETYGMVVAEALARGIPVLATAVGGVPETLGQAGVLVPPGDATALAGALRRWLGDPGLRDRLRAVARHRRTELDGWDTTARLMAGVLDRLEPVR
jgi:glycosyltransferase involved in cell wall biosynthesis